MRLCVNGFIYDPGWYCALAIMERHDGVGVSPYRMLQRVDRAVGQEFDDTLLELLTVRVTVRRYAGGTTRTAMDPDKLHASSRDAEALRTRRTTSSGLMVLVTFRGAMLTSVVHFEQPRDNVAKIFCQTLSSRLSEVPLKDFLSGVSM